MNGEQNKWKEKLEKELKHLEFVSKDQVLMKTHPKSWKHKFHLWWNKEISIPLLPLSAAAIGLIFLTMNFTEDSSNMSNIVEKRYLVEKAGNTYWSDLYERAVGEK